MTTVEFEAQHPRGKSGQFTNKVGSDADLTLPTAPASFSEAHTFSDIDRIWKAQVAAATGFIEEWQATDAAIARGQELREAGEAATVPTKLEGNGFSGNPYTDCQNDAELSRHFLLLTEEAHGDGEWSKAQSNSYVQRQYEYHDARRAELLAAGAVEGEDSLA